MKRFLITFCLAVVALVAMAQGPQQDPRLREMLQQNDSLLLQRKIKELTNSTKEEDVQLMVNYYNAKRNPEMAEAVTKILKQRFPDGNAAFLELGEKIYNERDPAQNEKNYQELLARFGNQPAFKNRLDGSKYFVAVTFLGKNKPEKVMEYMNMIRDTAYKTNAFSYAAREAIEAKDYILGEKLIRKTFADLKGDTSKSGMDEFSRIFSELMYANGKYEEGFPYAKSIYDKQSKITSVSFARLKTTYIEYLIQLKKYREAYPLMEEQIRMGAGSPLIKNKFKDAYVAMHGSEQGFSELKTGIDNALKQKTREEVAKKMIHSTAYNFELKDLKGKSVKLNDFHGKVVILDFWATWCGPCKASFPMMQEAVNRFRNDKDVVFLFIHTMENSGDATKAAGDYIRDKKYTFNVLMDLKDPVAKVNKAAEGYKVRGIPAKFIIDGTGNIRFSTLGNTAVGSDAFLEEMDAMIEIAKKS